MKSTSGHQILKLIQKAFDGASIPPTKSPRYTIKESLDEAAQGKVTSPFSTVDAFMKDLLD